MSFGEKLRLLRNDNGLSQEALAEKINTTRQAISKWENGQGYPETEKLLMIGNIFNVSLDYLLKDSAKPVNDQESGFYVSKEMAEGYIFTSNKVAKYLSLGIFLIALSFIPYFLFEQNPSIYLIPTILLSTIGIGMFVSAALAEEDQYKILKTEPLLFDETYLKELTDRYEHLKKKYLVINVLGSCLLIAGILAFGIEKKFMISDFLLPYYQICIGLIAIGIYIIIRTSVLLDAYHRLVRNEMYTHKFSFKLRRFVRKKIDNIGN